MKKERVNILTGTFSKQGGFVKTWKTRFFVLRKTKRSPGVALLYYKSENSYKHNELQIDEIELKNAIVKEEDSKVKGKKNLFSVGVPGKRCYYISANSSEERKKWVETLKDLVREIASPPPSKPESVNTTPTVTTPTVPREKDTKEEDEIIKLIEQKQRLADSTLMIQKLWRGYRERKAYKNLKKQTILVQSIVRGNIVREAAREKSKRAKRRFNIITELLTTETSYVTSMTLLNDIFLQPLLKSLIISVDVTRKVFSNVDFLLPIHVSIQDRLSKRLIKWHPYKVTADIFLESIPEFSAYAQYVKNFNKSDSLIKNLMSENQEFNKFITNCLKDPRLRQFELPDLLIMPVQRLPRIEMLLKDLLKNTESDCRDHGVLQRAIKELTVMTQSINEAKKEADSTERLKVVDKKIKGKGKETLLRKGRILLREGMFSLIDKELGQAKPVYLFLFNDIIIISKQTMARKNFINNTIKFNLKSTIFLYLCVVEEVVPDNAIRAILAQDTKKGGSSPANVDSLLFKISEKKPNGKSCIFKTSSIPEKNLWLSDLRNAIEAARREKSSDVEDLNTSDEETEQEITV